MYLVLLGLLSGGIWGGLGYWLASDTGMRSVAWGGLLASPLIGIVIAFIAAKVRPVTLVQRLAFSWASLHLAVFLFALVLGLMPKPAARQTAVPRPRPTIEIVAPDPCRDPAIAQTPLCSRPKESAFTVAFQAVAMFNFSGFGLLFLPLSVANHYLVWFSEDRRATTA